MSDKSFELLDYLNELASKNMTEDEFRAYLHQNDYIHVRKLEDGTWVGLTPLIFSTGLCVGLDAFGWQRRYCYDDHALAVAEIYKLTSANDTPSGWIAKRPQ